MLMAKSTTSLKTVERTPVDYTDRLYWSGIIKMSLSKFFILSVLQKRPMHGYEIAREVECSTKVVVHPPKAPSTRCCANSSRAAMSPRIPKRLRAVDARSTR